jgi:hypothetical protein
MTADQELKNSRNSQIEEAIEYYLHDVLLAPDDGVSVEVSCGVKPEIELLLSVSLPLSEHISVQNVRVAAEVPQELEVDLVMCCSLRRQLHEKKKNKKTQIKYYQLDV